MWRFCHYCSITNNGVTIKPAKRIKPLNLFIVALKGMSTNLLDDVERLVTMVIDFHPESP